MSGPGRVEAPGCEITLPHLTAIAIADDNDGFAVQIVNTAQQAGSVAVTVISSRRRCGRTVLGSQASASPNQPRPRAPKLTGHLGRLALTQCAQLQACLPRQHRHADVDDMLKLFSGAARTPEHSDRLTEGHEVLR